MNQTNTICCYLCDSENLTKSRNQKVINYDNRIYTFYSCGKCGSYSLFPKLDDDSVANLYSRDYSGISADIHQDESVSYFSKFEELSKFILADSKSKRRSYLDYGCGFNPVTLGIASRAGLDCQGVEFSSDVVAQANQIFPGKVTTVAEFKKDSSQYDYIFMGDVIEHLSHPRAVLVEIGARLSNGGAFIAQGPLQGAFTFTHVLVGLRSRIFSRAVSNFPPYHVSLASMRGMQEVLKASNLEIIYLRISEPNWPAPNLRSLLRRPSVRGVGIFIPKLLDRAISKFIPKYGSHYFLVAQKSTD